MQRHSDKEEGEVKKLMVKNFFLCLLFGLATSTGFGCAPALPRQESPRQLASSAHFPSPAANRGTAFDYSQSMAAVLRAYLRHDWKILDLDLKKGTVKAELCHSPGAASQGSSCSVTMTLVDKANKKVLLWIVSSNHAPIAANRYIDNVDEWYGKYLVTPYAELEQELLKLGFDLSSLKSEN